MSLLRALGPPVVRWRCTSWVKFILFLVQRSNRGHLGRRHHLRHSLRDYIVSDSHGTMVPCFPCTDCPLFDKRYLHA
jgi:hypothetical protein